MTRIKNSNSGERVAALLIIGIPVVIGALVLGGWIFQLLWNVVMPGIFGLPVLTFWQGIGMWMLICAIGNAFKNSK